MNGQTDETTKTQQVAGDCMGRERCSSEAISLARLVRLSLLPDPHAMGRTVRVRVPRCKWALECTNEEGKKGGGPPRGGCSTLVRIAHGAWEQQGPSCQNG